MARHNYDSLSNPQKQKSSSSIIFFSLVYFCRQFFSFIHVQNTNHNTDNFYLYIKQKTKNKMSAELKIHIIKFGDRAVTFKGEGPLVLQNYDEKNKNQIFYRNVSTGVILCHGHEYGLSARRRNIRGKNCWTLWAAPVDGKDTLLSFRVNQLDSEYNTLGTSRGLLTAFFTSLILTHENDSTNRNNKWSFQVPLAHRPAIELPTSNQSFFLKEEKKSQPLAVEDDYNSDDDEDFTGSESEQDSSDSDNESSSSSSSNDDSGDDSSSDSDSSSSNSQGSGSESESDSSESEDEDEKPMTTTQLIAKLESARLALNAESQTNAASKRRAQAAMNEMKRYINLLKPTSS
jgi:hypothetical protein